uniref:flotillin-like FloA family protein n=1 Tax=Siminovitchia fortis TaxID=254758 RepID=UPI0016428736
EMSVKRKVIERRFIGGVGMEGIEVKGKGRIRVGGKMERVVGGGGEESVMGGVGEGVVWRMGWSEKDKKVVEKGDMIWGRVLGRVWV